MDQIIIDSAKRVYTQLGPGHSETTYQKALAHELQINNLIVDLERHLSVTYTDSMGNIHYLTSDRIDIFIHNDKNRDQEPDINNGNIILELKATQKGIQEQEIVQIKKYFRQLKKENTNINYGILINFPQPNSKFTTETIEHLIVASD